MAGQISMGARREIKSATAERYRVAGRAEKGRILDELCKVTGWHRKHAVRALANRPAAPPEARQQRTSTYDVIVKDALTALWEASDRICGKRLKVMIPILLPALERHGRLKLGAADRVLVLAVSAATIDRLLADTKIAAAGGKRRRVGFYSAIRREVPIRTFNDWQDPPPGFCEIDMVAHGGTSVAGAFIQTLTMVDVATGWTECLPLVTREGSLVVEAIKRAQTLFPWIILGADFDNDSAFMNDIVVPWCRAQKIEVTRSRAYKKNDQAFVEQKNGAVVRRLMGYGRFDGIETAQVMARLYAAARLHVNFFQPSFKLKEKRREGAKVIKRYHAPASPYERALAHRHVSRKIKQRLRAQYRTLDPVVLLSEIRAAQEELGRRIDRRGLAAAAQMQLPISKATDFAQTLGMSIEAGEPRGTHRRAKGKYKTRVRMPSKLDPHLATIEDWLAAEPQLTALAIVGRLAQRDADQFGPKQHSIVQRLLKALRRKAAERLIAATTTGAAEVQKSDAGPDRTAVGLRLPSALSGPANRDVTRNPSAHAERRLR
jgi:hypothetical protein